MSILGGKVAINHEGNVLLTKRRDFEVCCLPGGDHLEVEGKVDVY
jgi:hypothetical protein